MSEEAKKVDLRVKRVAKRKARTIEYAREQFAARGYDAVPVREFCDLLEVSQPTFFRDWESKAQLFIEATQEMDAERQLEMLVGDKLADHLITRLRVKYGF